MCAYVIPIERGAAGEEASSQLRLNGKTGAYPELERFTSSAFDLMFSPNKMCNNNDGKNNPSAAEENVNSRFTVPPFGSHENNQLIQINTETFPLNKLRVMTLILGLRACGEGSLHSALGCFSWLGWCQWHRSTSDQRTAGLPAGKTLQLTS